MADLPLRTLAAARWKPGQMASGDWRFNTLLDPSIAAARPTGQPLTRKRSVRTLLTRLVGGTL